MITREMIQDGFNNGNISIEDKFKPAGCVSLCCRIGDNAFYFAGMEDENLTSEEYLESYTMNEIIDMLYDILKDVKSAGENGLDSEELDYYESVLKSKKYKVKVIMSDEYFINAESPEAAEKAARERFGGNYLIDDVQITEIA